MAERWDLTKIDDGWVTRDRSGDVKAYGSTKDEAVKNTAEAATRAGDVSVRIHGTDGKIQEVRTYLRDADPLAGKG